MIYDKNNIFAKILRKEIPCHKVYEDEFSLSFMDIMPAADGHTLVISKTASRNILDCPANVLAGVISTTQRITRAVTKAFNADGVTIQQFNETAGGQEIFHLHFHIIPRRTGVKLNNHPRTIVSDTVLSIQAAAIRNSL